MSMDQNDPSDVAAQVAVIKLRMEKVFGLALNWLWPLSNERVLPEGTVGRGGVSCPF
jgi:hypothetical protein